MKTFMKIIGIIFLIIVGLFVLLVSVSSIGVEKTTELGGFIVLLYLIFSWIWKKLGWRLKRNISSRRFMSAQRSLQNTLDRDRERWLREDLARTNEAWRKK